MWGHGRILQSGCIILQFRILEKDTDIKYNIFTRNIKRQFNRTKYTSLYHFSVESNVSTMTRMKCLYTITLLALLFNIFIKTIIN